MRSEELCRERICEQVELRRPAEVAPGSQLDPISPARAGIFAFLCDGLPLAFRPRAGLDTE